jgi:peptide chain release factor subunit 3
MGYTCVLHLHTAIENIEVGKIISELTEDNKKKASTFLKSGSKGMVRIKCGGFLCLEKFETNNHLGNFTLRDEGMTIGLGKVIRVKPVKAENI